MMKNNEQTNTNQQEEEGKIGEKPKAEEQSNDVPLLPIVLSILSDLFSFTFFVDVQDEFIHTGRLVGNPSKMLTIFYFLLFSKMSGELSRRHLEAFGTITPASNAVSAPASVASSVTEGKRQ